MKKQLIVIDKKNEKNQANLTFGLDVGVVK
jgi:hypothetical protein